MARCLVLSDCLIGAILHRKIAEGTAAALSAALPDGDGQPRECDKKGDKKEDSLLNHLCRGLTKGNLSSHLRKLEQPGHVEIHKTYRDKIPLTVLRLTPQGRAALEGYKKGMRRVLAALEVQAQDKG